MYKKNQAGFTLIEILVSVTVMGILSVLIAQVFFTTVRSNTKTELIKELKQNGDYSMGVLTRMIQNAKSVDVCDEHLLQITNMDDSITNIMPESSSNPHPPPANICRIVASSSFLTSSIITLSGNCADALTFECEKIGDIWRSVKISFTLEHTGASTFENASLPYESTIVLRNINF
jgi:prepilin-type N-terminal cleavage/methylation domain-containing protein